MYSTGTSKTVIRNEDIYVEEESDLSSGFEPGNESWGLACSGIRPCVT